MEKQVQTIVCPNCGANVHNHSNCEYCGSLLVRFASRNEQINQSVFGKEAHIIPGLEENLKKNIIHQKLGHYVTTDVRAIYDNGDEEHLQQFLVAPIEQTDTVSTKIKTEKYGWICYGFDFKELRESMGESSDSVASENLFTFISFINSLTPDAPTEILEEYARDEVRKSAFLNTVSSSLFSVVELPLRILGFNTVIGTKCVYYIDFGADSKGASAMISEVFSQIAPISAGWRYISKTDFEEPIDEEKEAEAQKIRDAEVTKSNRRFIIGLIVGIIAIIIGIVILFT